MDLEPHRGSESLRISDGMQFYMTEIGQEHCGKY